MVVTIPKSQITKSLETANQKSIEDDDNIEAGISILDEANQTAEEKLPLTGRKQLTIGDLDISIDDQSQIDQKDRGLQSMFESTQHKHNNIFQTS